MAKDTITYDLIEFAAERQRQFEALTSPEERKERGQFGTHPTVAEFMAGMFSETSGEVVRVLDPGAGVGMLSAAVCQRFLKKRVPHHLEFELWETDPIAEQHLRSTMDYCRKALRESGHRIAYTIRTDKHSSKTDLPRPFT